MQLDWSLLICDQRFSTSPKRETSSNKTGDTAQGRSPFEADYDRVIYSKAFRRLGKTGRSAMRTNHRRFDSFVDGCLLGP